MSAAASSSSSTFDTPSADSVLQNRVVLVSIDGWGISSNDKGNAIKAAKTPNMDKLEKESLFCRIDASGLCVGLPAGVMGNSEVGHLTMGAGRVEFQDLVRINAAVESKAYANNHTLQQLIARAKAGNGRVHLLGLLSDGAVHSHISHLIETIRVLHANKVPQVYVQVFADGRDTPPMTLINYIQQLRAAFSEIGGEAGAYGAIATVQGRYYAMDRDKRWERVAIAYDALVAGQGDKVEKIAGQDALIPTIQARYAAEERDEFLRPIVVEESGLIADGDSLLFLNFRSDRMREISSVFACETEVPTAGAPIVRPIDSTLSRKNLFVAGMTQYDEKVVLPTLFPPQSMTNGLPEWISKHSLTQFHTAETEKYAHVTFFFAGGRELQYPGEERGLVASPKVATYDQAPEMSMAAVGESVIAAMAKQSYALVLCNLAAPDMVGHTGVYDKAVLACESCDRVIGAISEAAAKYNYTLVVTADHGNAEEMYQTDGTPKTSHTTNLIPLIVSPAPQAKGPITWSKAVLAIKDDATKPAGGLADVAPTVLGIMGLRVPKEMTGKNLVARD